MTDFRSRRAIEELDQLLSAGVSRPVDDVPSDLADLVALAGTVRAQTVLDSPDPAFRTHLRAQLLRLEPVTNPSLATRLRDRADAATATTRRALRVATASAVAASMLGTAGVAAAAESALPGDALYSVKTLVEDARLLLADGGVQDGQLLLAFARERLEELTAGTDRLSTDQLVDLLVRMDVASIAGAEQLLTAASTSSTSELLTLVIGFVDEQETLLRAVEDNLPSAAAPFLADSFENLRRIDLQIQTLAAPDCDCTDPLALPLAADHVIDVTPITIVPAGSGPAAPSRPCTCDAPVTVPPREPAPVTPPPADEPTPTELPTGDRPDPEPAPGDEPVTVPDPEPSDDPLVPLPSVAPSEVEELLDPVEDEVDDAVDLVDELLGG